MEIRPAFKIGQIVYLKTDPEQEMRIVTGYIVRETSILYYVSHGVNESEHYHFELSENKDVLLSLGIESGTTTV